MIEKIVTDLETSKKLKDLGILQESCFYWVRLVVLGKEKITLIPKESFDYRFYGNSLMSYGCGCCEHKRDIIEKISAWTYEELIIIDDCSPEPVDKSAKEIIEYHNELSKKDKKFWIDDINTNLKKWREGK